MSTQAEHYPDFQRSLSASLLRLRAKSPFFATLALFADVRACQHHATAATNGRDIWINPAYWSSLTPPEADGLLLHEVLHAALIHVPRRGSRIPLLWNYAADIVVNGIILKETTFKLPPDTLREQALENFSVEEVYELLLRDTVKLPALCMCDLWEGYPGDGDSGDGEGEPGGMECNSLDGLSSERRRVLESYWQHAREQAALIMASTGIGNLPAGLMRELDRLNPSTLPWKDYLWRYLVRTPTDFEEFDRRFLSQGLYLESLEGESVRVYVCVDTSGSVSPEQIRQFMSEVVGILRAYPHINCDFYYCDAQLYGPFEIDTEATMPTPQGGGGTDFRPFFDAITPDENGESLCVYLTDGYGYFPEEAPGHDVLWVVTPGGLDLAQFPFGETVRLLQDS